MKLVTKAKPKDSFNMHFNRLGAIGRRVPAYMTTVAEFP